MRVDELVDSAAQALQTMVRVWCKQPSLAGQFCAQPPPLEQLHAHQLFEFRQGFGDCRLRDRQLFRRPLQTAQLRHRQKTLNVPKLDAAV
ncbi:hypothetical protein SDC9_210247 [bioreactor metagenome]|uniref:Uncharacterized protein n=1 Tax=bioreactor metagenome TaxID=1076179 RepID=A0A645JFM0_9ZZZZ